MGILFNGIKYITLYNINDLKKLSLYDNLYFTLKDIFLNSDDNYEYMITNSLSLELTGGLYIEDITDNFNYIKMLDNKEFVQKILTFLMKYKNEHFFHFTEEYENNDPTFVDEFNNKYMKFVDWQIQFNELINEIEKLL